MKGNVFQVKNISDLKIIASANPNVVLGFTHRDCQKKEKTMMKKFLKDRAKDHSSITFAFVDLTDKQIEESTLDIIHKNTELYPSICYVRNGDTLIHEATKVNQADLFQSFAKAIEQYDTEQISDTELEMLTNCEVKKKFLLAKKQNRKAIFERVSELVLSSENAN